MLGENQLEDVTGKDPLSAPNPNQFDDSVQGEWQVDTTAEGSELETHANDALNHFEVDDGELTELNTQDSLTSYNDLIQPPSYADTMFESGMGDRSSLAFGSGGGGGEITSADTAGDEQEEVALEGMSPPLSIPRSGAPPLKGLLEVSVSDPIKRDDAASTFAVIGKKYVEYLVTTKTSLPGFQAPQFSTRRRFRDFVALADTLHASHRGYVIPQRPEKSLVEGQMSAELAFMEDRRRQLERYLHALAAHPVLRHSAELRLFLELQTDFASSPQLKDQDSAGLLGGAARLHKQIIGAADPPPATAAASTNSQEAVAAGGGGGGANFMRVFREMRQAVVQSPVVQGIGEQLGVPQGGLAFKPTLEDDQHLTNTVASQVSELDRQLQDSSRRAEQLALRRQALGDVLGELGMSLIKLSNFHEQEGARRGQYTESGSTLCAAGRDVGQIGRTAVRLARLSRSASSQLVAHLEPLHEFLAVNHSVRRALQDRTNALLSAQTLESELKAKNDRLARLENTKQKVFGGEKSHEKRVEDLKREIESCEIAHRTAVQEYSRIKDRNLAEWDRLCSLRGAQFSHMLTALAQIQAALAVRSAAIWLQVAKELGGDVEADELSLSKGPLGQTMGQTAEYEETLQ